MLLVLTQVLLSPTLLVYKYHSCVLLYLRLNIAFTLPLDSCASLPRLRLVCCALSAPTSDFGPSRPLTLWNSFGVPATLPSTLRTHLKLHSTLVSHSCQSLVRPTCNRQVVNLPAGLGFSFLPSRHVQTPVGVPFMTSGLNRSRWKRCQNTGSDSWRQLKHTWG